MRRIVLWTASLPLALLVAGCGDGNRAPDVATTQRDTLLAPAHEPAAGLDRPPGGLATEPMAGLSGVAASGEVTVFDRGDQTELTVALSGLAPDAEHAGHLHSGTCAAIGAVVRPLDPIRTDSTGMGSMTTDLAIDPALPTAERLVVVYHADSRPVACGALPRPDPARS